MSRIALPPEEEKKRKVRMTNRLCFLFSIFIFVLIGIIVFEILQLI